MNKRHSLISIDILRAVAALGVFFYHQHVGMLLARYTDLQFLVITDIFGAEYAVPLFFLISGYCIHLSNIKYIKENQPLLLKQYYKRRLLRIYPTYLAALLFAILVNYFTYNKVPTFYDVIIHLFLLQGFSNTYFNTINVVLWTISIELAFYIIYPAFYFIRLKYSLNRALLFALLVTVFSITFFSLKNSISLPERFCVFNLWFAWCCGAYLADKYLLSNKRLFNSELIIPYLFIIVAFIMLRNISYKVPIVNDQLKVLIWVAPLCFFLSKEKWFIKQATLFTEVLRAIGLSSFSLYLLHTPLIKLKNFLAHKYLPVQLQFPGIVVGVLIIPVITWYSFKYIEKPFIRKKAIEHTA